MSGLKLIFSKVAIDLPDQPVKPIFRKASAPVVNEGPKSAESSQEMETEIIAVPESVLQGAEAQEAALREEDGLIPINSPLLGIFYRAPKPGAPPFVEIGSYVTEDDTVCLVEVMKLFNTVKAGVKGRIAKICIENNQVVEYNQTLFLVEPEESP
jgi:acetyl-CoA carboxylase biotin carboxyl carrier protein